MSRLNQINRWINQHSIRNKLNEKKNFDVFLFFILFFAVALDASPLSYAIQSEKEARADGTKNVF